MAKFLENFLSLGMSSDQSFRQRVSARFFLSFVLPGFLILAVFTLRSFLLGNFFSATFYITVILASIINTLFLIRTKNINLASTVGSVIAVTVVLYLFFTTGPFHEGHIWLIVLPIIVFILNGKDAGLNWTLSLFLFIGIIVLLGETKVISFPYTFQTFWATSLAAGCTAVCMFFFENILYLNQKEIEKFKLAVDHASNHIIITDPDGHILYANKAATEITGYSLAEMIGQTPALWGHQMATSFYEKFWKTIKTDKKPFLGKLQNKRKSGEVYTAEINVSPVIDVYGNINYFVGIERDITRETEAQEASEKLAAIVRDTDEAIFSKNLKGTVLTWNEGAQRMYGYTPKEAIGKNIKDLIVPKNKYKEVDDIMDKVLSGQRVADFQTVRSRKNGISFDASITFSPIHENGKVVGVSVIARDITKERQIDQMKTEFVSLASHQLRTPLTTIKWYLEFILDKSAGPLSKDQEGYIKDVYESNENMIALVNALLNVSRLESGRLKIEPVSTNLYTLIENVIKELSPQIKQGGLVVTNKASQDIEKIKVDPQLVTNVYMNLITNSIKYTPEKGKITVDIKKEGQYLISSVTDSGIGIPTEEQEHIFERFFRGSNVSNTTLGSTGLGLYLAKKIVETSGGKIWFESKVGKGSTFYFSLPISGSPARQGEVSLS